MNDHKPSRSRILRPPTLLLVLVCGAFLTLGALFFVWQRFQFVRLGFEVSELRQREARLREELEPLEVEAQYLARPERIEILARERLGMRPPLPSQIIVLETGESPEPEAE